MSVLPTLVTHDRDRFEPLGVNGEPVWRRDVQIRDVLGQRLGDRHTRLFAVPKPQRADAMSWSATRDGAVVRWSAATAEQRMAAATEASALLRDIDELIERLRAHDSDSSQILAQILETACYVGSVGDLFLVDGELVAAHWGMVGRDQPEAQSVLPRLVDLAAREPAPEAEPEAVADASDPVHEPRQRVWYLRIPVAAGLLFGLLALMLVLWAVLDWFGVVTLPRDRLEVPRSAIEDGDLGFLKGDWEVLTELFDIGTSEPVKIVYSFGADGRGEVRSRLSVRKIECRGPVQVTLEGDTLRFKHTAPVRCPDGNSYSLTGVRCEVGPDGEARCVISQEAWEDLDVIVQRLGFWS